MYIPLLALASAHVILAGQADAAPTVQVSPAVMLAGSHQRVQFTFTSGGTRIEPGGGVRIELPVAYLETGPYYWDRPQTDYPEGRGWVSALSSNAAPAEVSLRGCNGGIIEAIVPRGSVGPGEQITLEYAGVVQSLTWELPVRAQWRPSDQEAWRSLTGTPVITFVPQKAVTLRSVSPADVRLGESFALSVVLLDKFGNRASGYRGAVSFASTDPHARLPQPYTFTADDAGAHVFTGVRYETAGFQKITMKDGTLRVQSYYSDVHPDEPKRFRYFGETHFHTGGGMRKGGFTESSGGGDHRGNFTTQHGAYGYARDVMRLDFASAAEHDAEGFDTAAWARHGLIYDRGL